MPDAAIVFDVNETLLDVQQMAPLFLRIFGDAAALPQWFPMQLLHSQSLTLAGLYFDFSALAAATLQMMATARRITLSQAEIEQVQQAMISLPPYPEVRESLKKLRNAGLRLFTLTNSSTKGVEAQVRNAGLAEFFERNFSVDAVRRYKPAPEVYRMVASELKLEPAKLRMVAAHGWDVFGAMRAGLAGAFVARPGKAVFPLTPAPEITGPDLMVVAQRIIGGGIDSAF